MFEIDTQEFMGVGYGMPSDFIFEPNPEQQQIIDHSARQLRVIACAGSGKTEAISRRVARLISEGAEPKSIVAFTFTERAAESLKTRILLRVAEQMGNAAVDGVGSMYVGTIHSYCYRLIQEHVPQYANFDVLDDHRHAALLSREFRRLNLERLGGNGHFRSIGTFIRNADVIENELIPLSKFVKSEFGQVYRDYLSMLQRYRFLTYGRLISTAVSALQTPGTFEAVHSQLKHLFVDEYQDINPAQAALIQLLAVPPVSLCVVGDDDQAIYQWRGSDVSNMQEFRSRFRTAKTLPLSTNRRSRPGIIWVANRFAKSIDPRLKKKMNEKRESDGPEFFPWSADSPEDEAQKIAETVQNLHVLGYRYKDVGILLRSVRTSSRPIINALRGAGIPVKCAGRTGLFQQPEIDLLGQTYAWLTNRPWLSASSNGPETVTLQRLVKQFASVFELSGKQIEDTKGRLREWKSDAESNDAPANLVRDFYRLLRNLGVHRWDAGDNRQSLRLGTLARFSQLLADFEHTRRRARWTEKDGESRYLGGQSRGPYLYLTLFNYLQYYAKEAYEDYEEEESSDDVVSVLTVHQAKGLEWPVVFLPSLVQGRFPSTMAGRPGHWLVPKNVFGSKARLRYEGGEMDERRLFYVALTRARDMLYASCFRRIKNRKTPSPFILEIADDALKSADILPLPPPYSSSNGGEQDSLALSFSEIVSYHLCPLSYQLSALLGFQPQLVPELGYGKAVHHLLRRIADHVQQTGQLPSNAHVAKLMRAEFYLPYANQFAYVKLHDAAIKLIDRYLGQYGNDLFRVWVTERPFELHVQNGIVTGRADVILDKEDGIPGSMAIVDYKTSTVADNPVYGFQLAIYAAAGRAEGINVRAAYVHNLRDGERNPVPIQVQATELAKAKAEEGLKGIAERNFPAHKGHHCSGCDVRLVCRHGPAR